MEQPRKRRKLEIIPDKDEDVFTRSICNCDFCTETHEAVVNWNNQNFETKLNIFSCIQ